MTVLGSAELIAEVEAAAKSGLPGRPVRILHRSSWLLCSDSGQLQPQRVRALDKAIVRPIGRVEARSLVEPPARQAEPQVVSKASTAVEFRR